MRSWSSWRGIADLTPGGGFGDVYTAACRRCPAASSPAYARIPGARQPHRVLVQVPDSFDALAALCLVVAASSGSRGIYGAIAVAGSWGLAHGSRRRLYRQGRRQRLPTNWTPRPASRQDGTPASTRRVGLHPSRVRQPRRESPSNTPIRVTTRKQTGAATCCRRCSSACSHWTAPTRNPEAEFTAANTRTLGVGVSNGGGAVLRAAEIEGDWFRCDGGRRTQLCLGGRRSAAVRLRHPRPHC